jgi:long-chain acyl-CoA synthetase
LDDFDNQNAFYGDYFRTGDCGYMDADGYLYLIGREKELINVGGKKVSPMEVEDAIMSLGVGDCVCVPIKDTQGIIGEQVFCYVLKGSTTLSFEEISQKLSAILEFYKRPVAYDWIDEIPMTASGKKQRLQVTK